MDSYKNYIYLTICEVNLISFKNTSFLTYTNYCREMAIKVNNGNLTSRDKREVAKIFDAVEPIFSLNREEIGKHIVGYFNLSSERIKDFEMAVKSTKEFFPNTGD